MKITSSPSEEKGLDGAQLVTRPSLFVVALYWSPEEEREDGGLCSVRMTGMFAAGLPSVVSRTWHVIGGFFSDVAMVGVAVEELMGFWEEVEAANWCESASMRAVA